MLQLKLPQDRKNNKQSFYYCLLALNIRPYNQPHCLMRCMLSDKHDLRENYVSFMVSVSCHLTCTELYIAGIRDIPEIRDRTYATESRKCSLSNFQNDWSFSNKRMFYQQNTLTKTRQNRLPPRKLHNSDKTFRDLKFTDFKRTTYVHATCLEKCGTNLLTIGHLSK